MKARAAFSVTLLVLSVLSIVSIPSAKSQQFTTFTLFQTLTNPYPQYYYPQQAVTTPAPVSVYGLISSVYTGNGVWQTTIETTVQFCQINLASSPGINLGQYDGQYVTVTGLPTYNYSTNFSRCPYSAIYVTSISPPMETQTQTQTQNVTQTETQTETQNVTQLFPSQAPTNNSALYLAAAALTLAAIALIVPAVVMTRQRKSTRPQPMSPRSSPAPAAGGKFCVQCGKPLTAGGKFCGECGAPTPVGT